MSKVTKRMHVEQGMPMCARAVRALTRIPSLLLLMLMAPTCMSSGTGSARSGGLLELGPTAVEHTGFLVRLHPS